MQEMIGKGVEISWLGHSTFYLVTPEKRRILLDPWVDTNPACPEPWKATVREGLDAIFLSHGHSDHLGELVTLAKETHATIVCQFDVLPWLREKGFADKQLIGFNKGGTIEVAGLRATMTNAQHSSTLYENGKMIPMGDAAGYILRFSHDFTIYYTGDTSVSYDMLIMGDLYHPDLTLLPIGDFFTMDPRQAAYALRLIRPQYAIGYHWGTFPILTGTPEALIEACKEMNVDTQVIPLRPGESVC